MEQILLLWKILFPKIPQKSMIQPKQACRIPTVPPQAYAAFNYLLLTPNINVMGACAGSWLPRGFYFGYGCGRESGATPAKLFPEVGATPALGKRGKMRFIQSYQGSVVLSRAGEGEPICNRGYPKITRKMQCLYSAGGLCPTACES